MSRYITLLRRKRNIISIKRIPNATAILHKPVSWIKIKGNIALKIKTIT
jgi:hypothetical protein